MRDMYVAMVSYYIDLLWMQRPDMMLIILIIIPLIVVKIIYGYVHFNRIFSIQKPLLIIQAVIKEFIMIV